MYAGSTNASSIVVRGPHALLQAVPEVRAMYVRRFAKGLSIVQVQSTCAFACSSLFVGAGFSRDALGMPSEKHRG